MTEGYNCLMAIICIAILAIVCAVQDLDGQILALAIVAVAGLGGYEVYQKEKAKNAA